jgi:uncharacterized protein involved in response to NO
VPSGSTAQTFVLRPFVVLAGASLSLGTLGGFGLGLLLMLSVAFGLPSDLPWLSLVQVHGQVQTLGFAGVFIFAVGTILFPRFLSAPRWDARQAELGGLLLAAGVVLRALAQPVEPSTARSLMLISSGLLTLVGPLLFAGAVVRSCRASVQPFGAWQLALGIGFGSLGLSLVLNLGAVLEMAIAGTNLVRPGLDDAIVHLQLRGFLVGVPLAVSLKVFPQFLLLRSPRAEAFGWLLPAYLVGLLVGALSWLMLLFEPTERVLATAIRASGDLLTLLALGGVVLALRLYEPAARKSERPQITNPTRLWFRLAYAWLLVSTLLNTALSIREVLGGALSSFTELSAARHALTMGFLLVLLFGMAARILPGYSGWTLKHPRFLAGVVGLLTVAAFLRVGGELAGGYTGVFGPITGLGGMLGTLGFLLFAASLGRALARLPTGPVA